MEPVDEEQQIRQVSVRCSGCGRQTSVEIAQDEMKQYLMGEQDSSN
jgi:hypothetical protein